MRQYNVGLYKGTTFNDDSRLTYIMQTSSSYFSNYSASIKGAILYPVIQITPKQGNTIDLTMQGISGRHEFSVSGDAYILNDFGGWSISANLPSGTLTTTLSFPKEKIAK